MQIDFLDPDANKKKLYVRLLKAVERRAKKSSLNKELIAEFFERKQLNKKVKNPDLLNLIGWVRSMFRLQPFDQTQEDLRKIGLILEFSEVNKRKIKNEFNKRNRKKHPGIIKTKRPVEIVKIKRRKYDYSD